MEELLSDRSKFVKIEFNSKHTVNQDIRHLVYMESEIKSCLDNLLDKNYLPKNDYKYLEPCGSKLGIIYGLFKIHKGTTINGPVPPFLPILSAIGTCSYNIAKICVPTLKQFSINEYTTKDSFSFCKEILDQDPGLYVVSLDIQSLFINITLDETINICLDLVFREKKKVKDMLKRHFKQLLTLSVKSSCFRVNVVSYKQVDGVAMGSPLTPTLTNLFLVYYEHKLLENCPLQFWPKYYCRYIDDIFFMFENRDHVKKFLKHMNSCYPNFSLLVKKNPIMKFLSWKYP